MWEGRCGGAGWGVGGGGGGGSRQIYLVQRVYAFIFRDARMQRKYEC